MPGSNDAAEFGREDTAATKLDKLAALLSRSGDSTPETVAVFADLLGLPTEGRYPPPPTDPRQRRELILAALVRQLEGLARHRPVLFVVEDAHWINSTSLELLERVAERVRRLPVLMIVTYRPEFEPPWTGECAGDLVDLKPARPARDRHADRPCRWRQGAAGGDPQ